MILFYLLILAMPLPEHPLFGTYFGSITLIKYVGLACIPFTFWHLLRAKRIPRFFSTPQIKWLMVFFLIATCSYAFVAPATSPFNSPIIAYASFLLLVPITLILVDTRGRLRRTVLVLIASMTLASAYLIREWQHGIAIYGLGYRPGWVTGDANLFAACVVLTYPLVIGLLLSPVKRIDRRYAALSLALIAFAMLICASRGGFLGLIVAGLFMLRRSKRRFRGALLAVLILGISTTLVPSSSIQRLLHPDRNDVLSEQNRLSLWKSAISMVEDRPFTGVGLGNFSMALMEKDAEEKTFHVPHNTYLSMAAEMGIPGLTAFVLTLLTTLYSLEGTVKRAIAAEDKFVATCAANLQAGLAGCCISMIFLSAQQAKLLWFVIALSAALRPLINKIPILEPDVLFVAPGFEPRFPSLRSR